MCGQREGGRKYERQSVTPYMDRFIHFVFFPLYCRHRSFVVIMDGFRLIRSEMQESSGLFLSILCLLSPSDTTTRERQRGDDNKQI